MPDAILINSDYLKVSLLSAGDENGIKRFDRIGLHYSMNGDAAQAAVTLYSPLEIPASEYEILFDANNTLRSFDDIARDPATTHRALAELAKLRDRLARDKLAVSTGADFFGLTAGAEATVELVLPKLTPAGNAAFIDLRLSAEVTTEVESSFAGSQIKAVGHIAIDVHASVSEDTGEAAVTLALSTVAEGLDGVGLNLPEIPFPSLALDGVDLTGLVPFQPPVPGFARELADKIVVETQWPDGHTATLNTDAEGRLAADIRPNGQVTLNVRHLDDAQAWLSVKISDLAITLTDGALNVEGTIANTQLKAALNPWETDFGGGRLPVRGRIALKPTALTWDGNTHTLSITWEISELAIWLIDDPKTRISGSVVVTTHWTKGKFDYTFANASIDDAGATAIDVPDWTLPGLLPIRLDLKPAQEFLRKLARILAALLRYLARAAGALAGMLADLAEAAAKMLADAIKAILEALDGATDGLVIELRLDQKGWALRQLAVYPAEKANNGFEFGNSLLRLGLPGNPRPGMVYDFQYGWVGLVPVYDKRTPPKATLSTDLWLSPGEIPATAVGEIPTDPQKTRTPLLNITAEAQETGKEIVPVALRGGRVRFLQSWGALEEKLVNGASARLVAKPGPLDDLTFSTEDGADVKVVVDYDGLKEKLLSLLPAGPTGGGADDLLQRVKVKPKKDEKATMADGLVKAPLTVEISVGAEVSDPLQIEADIDVALDLNSFEMSLEGDEVDIKTTDNKVSKEAFGLSLVMSRAPGAQNEWAMFTLKLGDGNFRLEKSPEAKLEVLYRGMSSGGRGLVLEAKTFAIGQSGLDLEAVATDEAVMLAGIDQAFTFTEGSIVISQGELVGGTLKGSGTLPPALIGEAQAEVALGFGAKNGRLKVTSAKAVLSNDGKPLYSTGTRFKFALEKIELDYRDVDSGQEHFFFLLWGEAAFAPAEGEFASGLMKNFKQLAIRLDGAPITGDGSELIKHISFLAELETPITENLFDVFEFELRGISFHPASAHWADHPAALGFAGQVMFMPGSDVVRATVECHELQIARADPARTGSLPRLHADGLSVLLEIGGLARVGGRAIAVDGSLPSLNAGLEQPSNIKADGFLASGVVEIKSLGAYSGAMGFLQLTDTVQNRHKNAMFLYVQADKLSERIDTPVGPLWVKAAGAGIAFNYDLTALALADQAVSPRDTVAKLDEISKTQGNLTDFNAWTPQTDFDKNTITLVLRGMIATASGSMDSSSYETDLEKTIANPLLMDIVLALRSDLTFFASVRGWLATNYHDWVSTSDSAPFKSAPSLRGYLYLSVPRREFLARFLADGSGVIGKHPELDENLVNALNSSRFAATLYIRPGLYHMELGWPYEIGFDLGEPGKGFWLSVSGGMIFRIEEATALFGIAFKASGGIVFEARVGSDSFGASVTARASFAIGARFIAYIAPLAPNDTLFYGDVFLNLTLDFGVQIWLSFKIVKRITLRIGFSIQITVSIAAELVVSPQGIGAQVHASVGVRGFGRTLSVGIGFSFGDDALARARARVARFMSLGLGVALPETGEVNAPAPAPEPARKEQAIEADKQLDEPAPPPPPPPKPEEGDPDETRQPGLPIGESAFWAILFDAGKDTKGEQRYVMQLVPRDHSHLLEGESAAPSTFFAEPFHSEGEGTPDVNKTARHADYRLRAVNPGELPKKRLTAEKQDEPATTGGGKVLELSAKLDKRIGDAVTLNALMANCFLSAPYDGTDPTAKDGRPVDPHEKAPFGTTPLSYGEPHPILWNNPGAPGTASPREARLDQASRSGAFAAGARLETRVTEAALLASVEVTERRSALVNKIGDTLREIAGQLRRGAEEPAEAEDNIDARDFGLTFMVTDAELDQLFPGKESRAPGTFTVAKRAWQGRKWGWSASGSVHLLRHPGDSFTEKQPRLVEPRVAQAADGLTLHWDLEPAHGRSGGAGPDFIEDPETYLDYYQIERSFEGLALKWNATFQTRTATRLSYQEAEGGLAVSRARAETHLCDDLSAGGIPEDFRALILGTPIPSRRRAREVWDEVTSAASVTVNYKVVAVDEMGTRTGMRILSHDIKRPAAILPAPLSAGLTLAYEGDLPTPDTHPAAPELRIELVFASEDERVAAITSVYKLRVWGAAILGGGSFGSDAVDDAKSRPSSAQIEQAGAGDTDLYLVPAENGATPALELLFLHGEGESEAGTGTKAGFVLHDGTNGRTLGNLFTALGATGPLSEPKARRVFLRRQDLLDDDGPKSGWIVADLLLKIAPAEPQGEAFHANLDTFERPVSLDFEALSNEHVTAEAGRLELQSPAADATLAKLIDSTENPIIRHLDPEGRGAIGLTIDVHGAAAPIGIATDMVPGLIGGFDIFTLDPARMRVATDLPEASTLEEFAARDARHRATLKVLPRSLAGQHPDSVPDFQTIEARYPSATHRYVSGPREGRKAARWYAEAETLVAFPEARLRRSLFVHPDETMIAELLDQFDADTLTIQVAPVAGATGPIAEALSDTGVSRPSLTHLGMTIKTLASRGPLREITVSKSKDAEVPTLQARDLRAVMRLLRFAQPKGAPADAAYATWRRGLAAHALAADADGSSRFEREAAQFALAVTFIANATAGRKGAPAKRKTQATVRLGTALHPVLEETLALMCYDSAETNKAPQARHPGRVYRRYEPVREPRASVEITPDPQPTVDDRQYRSVMATAEPGIDPYGWGALRMLGLAEGFRLYDTEAGRFLTGKALLERVNLAFAEALAIYGPDGDGNGGVRAAPFVEIVNRADAFMATSSEDGRNESVADDHSRLLRSEAAIVQIALRPRPAQRGAPAPVRYLVLRRKARNGGSTVAAPEKPIELNLAPEHMVLDLKLRGEVSDERVMRWMHATAEMALYGTEGIYDTKPKLDVETQARLVALPDGTIAGYLRATTIASDEGFAGFRESLAKLIGSIGLEIVPGDVTDPRALAGDANPFERFPPLPGALLTWLSHNSGDPTAPAPFETLLQHLPPGAVPGPGFTGSAALDAKAIANRKTTARAYAAWTARFLEHGSANTASLATADPIGFALVAIVEENRQTRLLDPSGHVTAFFIEPSRLGREKLFAVRPFGRYAGVEAQLEGQVRQPALKARHLGTSCLERVCATSLQRSRPLIKPGFLSTSLQEDDVELAVARSADQMTGLANIPAERALQPGWTGVELRADFPGLARARQLAKTAFSDWRDQAINGDGTGVLDGEILKPEELVGVVERAPTVWRGAIVYRFRGLPHFLDITALAHQSAGVAVSDVAGMRLPRRVARPNLPAPEPVPDEALLGRTDAPRWWAVVRSIKDEVTDETTHESVELHFDLPLARHVDLMGAREREALLKGAGKLAPIHLLPDARASYRISTRSADRSAVSPQIEILPNADPATRLGLYAALTSGPLFENPARVVSIQGMDKTNAAAADLDNTANWRLGLRLAIAARDVAALTELNPGTIPGDLDGAVFKTPPTEKYDAALWAAWAPWGKVVITWDGNASTDEMDDVLDDAMKYFALFQPAQHVEDALATIRELREQIEAGTLPATGTRTVTLPFGVLFDGIDGVTFSEPTDPYTFPDGWPDQQGRFSLAQIERIERWIWDGFDSDRISEPLTNRNKLVRTRWLERNPLGFGDLDAVYEPTSPDLQVLSLPKPFVAFEIRSFDVFYSESLPNLKRAVLDAVEALAPVDLQFQRLVHDRLDGAVAPGRVTAPVPLVADEIEGYGFYEVYSHAAPRPKYLGFHRLPDAAELKALMELGDDVLRDRLVAVLDGAMLGRGGALLSVFHGGETPASADIQLAAPPEGWDT